jgi:hypothetical protein
LGLGASLLFGLVACGLQPPLTHQKSIQLAGLLVLPRFIVHSKEIQIKIFISFPFSIRLGQQRNQKII